MCLGRESDTVKKTNGLSPLTVHRDEISVLKAAALRIIFMFFLPYFRSFYFFFIFSAFQRKGAEQNGKTNVSRSLSPFFFGRDALPLASQIQISSNPPPCSAIGAETMPREGAVKTMRRSCY